MMQYRFFDWQKRFETLDTNKDPLVKLMRAINWDLFRAELEAVRDKQRKSAAGAKPYDAVLMFKILILQSLYNLSDEAVEYQILDRMSFKRFLGLQTGDPVPDAKTIWLFREQLKAAGRMEHLFTQFMEFLAANGYADQRGQIVVASIEAAPRQRNSREDNRKVKEGTTPADWQEAQKRQKDVDARWTKKNGTTYYGYKNHVDIDVRHKFIRGYAVTDASVHDSQVFEELLDENNSSRDVYADSAYRFEKSIQQLEAQGFREHLQRKGCKNRKLTKWEQQGNRTRARKRSRIEHVFGVQAMMAGNLLLRCIGIIRARVKIGLRNLAYNINRYALLKTTG
jgi:IS5 family transposase